MMEQALRRSLALSNGDWSIFIDRPITLTILIISFAFVAIPILLQLRRKFKGN
jgi:putative tricarboxylic transport membrane protein